MELFGFYMRKGIYFLHRMYTKRITDTSDRQANLRGDGCMRHTIGGNYAKDDQTSRYVCRLIADFGGLWRRCRQRKCREQRRREYGAGYEYGRLYDEDLGRYDQGRTADFGDEDVDHERRRARCGFERYDRRDGSPRSPVCTVYGKGISTGRGQVFLRRHRKKYVR